MHHKYTSMTNGCFDCLHAGHYQFLKYCKDYVLNATLFVFMDSDEKLRKDKGPGRPVFTFKERERLVMQTGLVHAVIRFESDTQLAGLYKHHAPDYLFKGEDWQGKKVVGSESAKQVIFVPHKIDISTSLIYDSVMKGINHD